MMNKIVNLILVVLMMFSNVFSLGGILANAEGFQDVSSELLSGILVDKQEINDGGKLKIKATFDDRNKKIESGDMIKVAWPTMNNVKGQGFSKTYPFSIDGVTIGQAVITLDGAVLTFNDNVNQFDRGTVKGGFDFEVQFNNMNDKTSTEEIHLTGGNITTAIKVSKKVSQGGNEGEVRNFSDKNGLIYVNDTSRVFWDISLNGNKDAMASDIRMVDTIKDSPKSHKLLPETFYFEVKGPNKNKVFRGTEGVEQLKNEFNATFNYSVEEGTIEVVIPKQQASYNSFRIAYYTQITDEEVASFKNEMVVDYQVHNKEPQQDNKEKIIDNIGGGAWGEGSKLSKLTVVKKDGKSNKPLAGATFNLKSKDGVIVRENLISDENGQIIIKNLEPKEYFLEEVNAPEGYKLLEEPVLINVNKVTVEKEILNMPEEVFGGIEIFKVDSKDESKGLSGAKFVLKSELTGETAELVSDENGKAKLEGLAIGKYSLVETEAPEGYELDPTVHLVEVTKNKEAKNITNVTIANEAIEPLGSVEVTKVDKGNLGIKLADTIFELKEDATGKVIKLVTDENGKATASDLPLGEYTIKELKAPKGYLLDSKEQSITVEQNEATANKVAVVAKNTKVTPWIPLTPSTPLGSVEITKVDSKDASKVLAEAEFKLKEVATSKEYKLVTDATGKANVNKLPLGAYTLEETKAPAGYVLNKEIIELEVKEDKETKNTTAITVENEVKVPWTPLEPSTPLGGVEITKVDSKDASKVLAEAEFKLKEVATSKEYKLITDATGKASINKLPLGSYTLEETKAPAGYVLDKKVKELEVKEDKETKNTTAITVENEVKVPWTPLEPSTPLGSVEVTKVDKGNLETRLADTVFELKEDATGKVTKLVTDESGRATASELPLGEYTLKELKAPKGYLLDSKEQFITVEQNEATANKVAVVAKNSKVTPWLPLEPSTPLGSVEITKVDSKDTSKVLAEAEFKLKEVATSKEYKLITDATGKASIDKLPLGAYTLEETKAPAGYELDKKVKELEVKQDKETKNTTVLVVKNEMLLPIIPLEPSTSLGSVKVTKVDSKDTSKVLAGAEFKLTETATSKEYKLVTDTSGKASINKLPLGAYTLEETKAPVGYILDKKINKLELKEDKATDNEVSLVIKNKLVEPTKEKPILPINGSKGETPKQKGFSSSKVPNRSSNFKMLPKTGESQMSKYFALIGLSLLMGVVVVLNFTRSKKIK